MCWVALAIALAGCGTSSTPRPATTHTQAVTPAVPGLSVAEHPRPGEFPSPQGRTLVQLARLVNKTATLGAANGVFTRGVQRLSFALTDKAQRFIYAPTAVYLASSPSSPARGPVPGTG